MSIESSSFRDSPPADDGVTDYDRAHSVTYLRLLDAQADGATWQEAASIIMGFNLDGDAERARRVHASHLERALWMTRVGYQHLLAEGAAVGHDRETRSFDLQSRD
jgi:hypothetical protein